MAVLRDRETNDDVLARVVDDPKETAVWLSSRGVVEHDENGEIVPVPEKHVGQWAVVSVIDGRWAVQYLDDDAVRERYIMPEETPNPVDGLGGVQDALS